MITSVILSLVGLGFLSLGYLIIRFKLVHFVAGYDPVRVKNPNALAVWVGRCMLATGLGALLIATLNYVFRSPNSDLFSFLAFMLLSMFSGVATLVGAQKYQD